MGQGLTQARIAGLRVRPCGALVPDPALSGSKAERTGTVPMGNAVAYVRGDAVIVCVGGSA